MPQRFETLRMSPEWVRLGTCVTEIGVAMVDLTSYSSPDWCVCMLVKQRAQSGRKKEKKKEKKKRADTATWVLSEKGHCLFLSRGNNPHYYRRSMVAHRY